MKLRSSVQRKIVCSLISVFLIVSFTLAPVSQILEVQRAEAQLNTNEVNPTIVGGTWGTYIKSAMSAVSDAATASGIGSMVTKEYILDSIVWPLINLVLQEMIKSTTAWVRSGFKGSPAFVTDLNGFLIDVADRAAGEYIWGNKDLNFLCSPFSLNIRLALDLQYRSTKRIAQCRLSTVFNNINGFLNSNFMNGGWDMWYNVALIPTNNPYGAMYEAQNGLYLQIAGRQSSEVKLLDFGSGFFSRLGVDGTIIAPGNVIQSQLNHTLGLSGDRIAVADELNELVAALFSQLALQALSGAGGLLGMNSSYQYQGNTYDSYYSAMAAQQPALTPTTQAGNITIQNALATESRYLTHQENIIGLITTAGQYKERMYNTNDSCTNGQLTPSLSNQLISAQNSATLSRTVIANLTLYLNDYSQLQNATTPQTTIQSLLLKYNAASIPAAQSAIMTQFMQYQSSGALHQPTELIDLELVVIPGVRSEVQSFTDSIDNSCNRANNNDRD